MLKVTTVQIDLALEEFLNLTELETSVTVPTHKPELDSTNESTSIRSTDQGSRLHTVYGDGINIYQIFANQVAVSGDHPQ